MKQRIPDIKSCPGTLAPGYDTYSPEALRRMFDGGKVSHLLDFPNDESSRLLVDENVRRVSVSGVQEKMSAVVEEGKVRLVAEGLQGRYIIKPAPDDRRLKNRDQMPANEHLTMQIARQVYGMETAENALIFFRNGEPAYITKRFDVGTGHTKIKQEDFASLMQKTSETHGKHLNTSLHVRDEDFALEGGLFGKEFYSEIYRRKGHPCGEDFIVFGRMIDLPDDRIHQIMQDYLAPQPLVYDLTQSSFLSKTAKRIYIRSYEERLDRLKRR
jgi:hypothetical protein